MRFYVVPELIFTFFDIIPMTIYPKPFIGVHFDYADAKPAERKPSEGMGIWKVKIGQANGLTDGELFPPDMYVKVEILSCMDVMSGARAVTASTANAYNSESASMSQLYNKQHVADHDHILALGMNEVQSQVTQGGSQWGSNRTNTTVPIVKNPGCVQETSTQTLQSSPNWDTWLEFSNAPMFQFEAARNERIKIEMWDDDGADWFNEDDLIDTVEYAATDAAAVRTSDRVHHVATINIAGGQLEIEVKWEKLSNEELKAYLKDGEYAPEPEQGCWRPDGMVACEDAEGSARRRLKVSKESVSRARRSHAV